MFIRSLALLFLAGCRADTRCDNQTTTLNMDHHIADDSVAVTTVDCDGNAAADDDDDDFIWKSGKMSRTTFTT